ncbi:hypothetical protein H5410_008361 [Solanum commersonii]|uniref:Uncharacterized protein n=1 Tax=Solanum commersonii TaxID=4109 RepID=A0A9J6AGK1_SOLCO|nr:hypothetical protein H5410_008361 [Solanum commersonii]
MKRALFTTLVYSQALFSAKYTTRRDGWILRIIPSCIWWTIWKERNDRCFEDRRSLVQDIKLKCILLFCFWCTKLYSSDTESILDVLGTIKDWFHIWYLQAKDTNALSTY